LQWSSRTDEVADVLERLGIVNKPPPLMEWAWDDLNLLDRPTVFKQLQVCILRSALTAKSGKPPEREREADSVQKDNKKYDMKEWEMKIRGGVEDKEPPEWQAYSKIKNRDRKRLFEILQVQGAS